MNKSPFLLFALLFLFACSSTTSITAQKKKKDDTKTANKSPLDKVSLSGLKFRNIGPAITSGRVSDIAVNPTNPFEYYVATASGGVWKTNNWGNTYKPIFDSQGSYSIGCVTMDPSNPSVIWVGTGENNNQRSVAYGDGVYKSMDGGASWKNMGLKSSEHIGKIIVHPDNSDVVWVAAIGPLWSDGGERGVYKTMDGGKTWELALEIDKYTGVTDLIIDPRNPDVLYAAAMQRSRKIFTYLGGGPGSGMHKTTDGGKTWTKINKGLPSVDIGRIGLAISPADPEIIYAIVEAAQGKGGFYRTTNRGASWHKQGSHNTSGNYYSEIIADPVEPNTVYSMDTWMKVSKDGGKTFKNCGEDYKHVDNHSMWINPTNNQHWLVGCDGGIYETWDAAKNWDFKENLPVTQFYKVAVDNDFPFYNIYGGTQDNFSLGGPSRVNTDHGITNRDWFITHGGDGFESQVDPENPDIVYAQSQHGVLVRYDRKSGEEVGIQPKERKGEDAYIWNWDAPLAVSHHASGRLYFAANKLFRSNDRGDSWEVLSDDLTRKVDRNKLKLQDRVWGIDAVAKNRSTSLYGAIVAFSESPVNSELLVVGTDDGLIQITTDGGKNWRKVDNVSGVPNRTYVNSVYASNHDENVIYAAYNNHKAGDFKPYIYRSSDKGLTWSKISNNLPERGSIYSIEEDHVDKDLIFCGTEFGVFFSPNAGKEWKQLKGGMPTIAIRDLAIQKRENDLVLGSFGRGFFVLDDYSALRSVEATPMAEEAQLFAIRDALMFEKAVPLGLPGKSFQGDNLYSAENLGPVAMITYYYPESPETLKAKRQKAAKKAAKAKKDNAYPTYDELLAESEEMKSELIFTIKDSAGKIVRKFNKAPKKGLQRFQWDLRRTPKDAISLSKPSFYNPFAGTKQGPFVAPGNYTVSMETYIDGETKAVGTPVTFAVKALNNTVLPAEDRMAKAAFQQEVEELKRSMQGAQRTISEMDNKLRYIRQAIKVVEQPSTNLTAAANAIDKKMDDIKRQFYGDRIKSRLDMQAPPTPLRRLGSVQYEQGNSTASPTKTHQASLAIAKEEFGPILNAIRAIADEDMVKLEEQLESVNAPYTPGRKTKIFKN